MAKPPQQNDKKTIRDFLKAFVLPIILIIALIIFLAVYLPLRSRFETEQEFLVVVLVIMGIGIVFSMGASIARFYPSLHKDILEPPVDEEKQKRQEEKINKQVDKELEKYWEKWEKKQAKKQAKEQQRRLQGKPIKEKKAKKIDWSTIFTEEIHVELIKKFEAYESDVNNRISDFLIYDEFVEIFSKSNGYPFVFIYRDTCFVMSKDENGVCEFSFTSAFGKEFDAKEFAKNTKNFRLPINLFEDARVEGYTIKEIWRHLERG